MTSNPPAETSVRLLVGALAEFPAGADSRDLCEKFRQIACRGKATFFACLAIAKSRGWIVQDGPTYMLAANGSWRNRPIGVDHFEHVTERNQKLERLNRRLTGAKKAIREGAAAGPAIAALTAIMGDASISTRKRIAAADQLLSFRSPQDIGETAKQFLCSVFADPEGNVDDRLAATVALRKSEDTRIMPPIERPTPVRPDNVEEPVECLADLVARQRARADQLGAELERQAAAAMAAVKSDGGDTPSEVE